MLANYEKQFTEITEKIRSIGEHIIMANETVLRLIEHCEDEEHPEVKTQLNNISKITGEIDHDLVTLLALHSPEATDLRTMVSYLKITNELLRATANTRSLSKGVVSMCEHIEAAMIKEFVIPMQRATIAAISGAISMIGIDCVDESQEIFNSVLIDDSKSADLYELIEDEIFKRAKEIQEFSTFHEILRSLRKSKKISDRALAIASLLLFAKRGGEIQQAQ